MIETSPLPEHALLLDYSTRGYTDCYITDVDGSVTLPDYVEAFYTTFVFRIERLVLSWLASRPSSDEDVKQLANGSANDFAAWNVERRAANQLLLADFRGHTRSWLMVEARQGNDSTVTRLYFGSAVVARHNDDSGQRTVGSGYSALLGFHRLYSRILLRAARARLASGKRADSPGPKRDG